jgi:type IX secretion system PorP/SprF family membrane protein
MFFSVSLVAQDIHFSQYFYSPLNLNPANTGNFDGDGRFVNNFRNQWKALSIPYRTIGVSFDHQLYIHSEQFSYGISIVNDKSGPAGLTVNKLFFALAYHKSVHQNHFHLGLQGGMVFKNYSLSALTFPSQFDMTIGHFNNHLPTDETNMLTNINYPDMNAGVGWDKSLRYFHPEIGISFFHLLSPKETFLDNNNKLPIRSAVNVGFNIPIGSFYVKPEAYQMRQHKATDMIQGLECGYNLDKSSVWIKRVFGGVFARNDFTTSFDASIIMLGVQIKQFQLGFSYDINTSDLSVATNKRGAFEYSLIYISKSTIPKKITLPCDRL